MASFLKLALKTKKLVAFLFLLSLNSFGQTKQNQPEVDPINIQKTFLDWNNYQSKNIILSLDFKAINQDSQPISKEVFLQQLTTGGFIPIRLTNSDSSIIYKLFPILSSSDSSIKATIISLAVEEYEHFLMEGKPFPDIKFVDLNGNAISNQSLLGKIVVIKCWYIHCTACIKEFPAVNQLVEHYKSRKDIVFISLAEDSEEQLKTFLARKKLSYAVVPNMKKFMNEELHLNAFPTHIIINKQGKIAKVLLDYEGLEKALEQHSFLEK